MFKNYKIKKIYKKSFESENFYENLKKYEKELEKLYENESIFKKIKNYIINKRRNKS